MTAIPGYRIVAEIGSGASATVHRAVQEGLDREVALKVLAPGLFDGDELQARFVREARIQANLAHPNLLKLFDAGVHGETPYLAMELVTGGSLRGLLDRHGSLRLSEAVRLGREIADGLACAHGSEIVHRDLKPENVLLSTDGVVKVADFGLAKGLASGGTLQTAAGTVMGTPGYMAPEALDGASTSPAADVYAIGVILYEMIAGRRPFDGEDPIAIIRDQMKGEYEALGSFRPGVPRSLEQLITTCLVKDPAGRALTAALIGARLEQLGTTMGDGTPELPPGAKASRSSSTRVSVKTSRSGPSATRASRSRVSSARPATGSGTRVGSSGSISRGALPGAKSAVDPANFRRTLAVLLLALGCIIAGWWAWWPAEDPGSNGSPASAPSTEPEPLRPAKLLRLDVGPTQVRLVFDRPLPETLDITVTNMERTWGFTRRLPAGGAASTLTGLASESELRMELMQSGAVHARTFHTLPVTREGWTILHPRAAETLEVRSRGDQIAVGWSQKLADKQQLAMVRRSFDGGLTWSEAVKAGAPCRAVSFATMAWLEDRFLIAWGQKGGEQGTGTLVLSLPSAAPGPGKASRLPGTRHDPMMRSIGPQEAELFTFQTDKSLIRWRLDPQGTPLSPSTPALEFQHDHTDRKCLWFTEAGRWLSLLGIQHRELDGKNHITAARAETRTPAAWMSPEPLQRFHSDAFGSFDSESLPSGRLVIAAEIEEDIRVRYTDDGGLTYSPWTRIQAASFSRQFTPVELVRGRQGMHLAHTDINKLVAHWLVLHHSQDGARWSRTGQVPLPPFTSFPVSRLVETGRGLVSFFSDAGGGLFCRVLPAPGH